MVVDNLSESLRIDAGKNVGAEPVDEERAERKSDMLGELRGYRRRPLSFDFLMRPSYWWASR